MWLRRRGFGVERGSDAVGWCCGTVVEGYAARYDLDTVADCVQRSCRCEVANSIP